MSEVANVTMTETDARKLTERIRITAHNYTEAKAKLLELVQEAKDGGAHEALGYASWTAYLAEVLGDEPLRLARDDRQDMVKVLSAEGMSTRAIAPIVGSSKDTVQRDIAGVSDETPAPAAPVQGLDGKQYARREPKPTEYFDAVTGEITTGDIDAPREPSKPKRRPLSDQFFDATYDLQRNIEKIERLLEDDRFPANKKQIALKHENDLIRTAEALTRALHAIQH